MRIRLLCAKSTSYVRIGFAVAEDGTDVEDASIASVCRTRNARVVPSDKLHIVAAGPRSACSALVITACPWSVPSHAPRNAKMLYGTEVDWKDERTAQLVRVPPDTYRRPIVPIRPAHIGTPFACPFEQMSGVGLEGAVDYGLDELGCLTQEVRVWLTRQHAAGDFVLVHSEMAMIWEGVGRTLGGNSSEPE